MLATKYRYGKIKGSNMQFEQMKSYLQKNKWFWQKEESLIDLVNELFELVEIKLGYYPDYAQFNITLVDTVDKLNDLQYKIYLHIPHRNAKAFMSESKLEIYVAVNSINRHILAHEFGHVLFEHMINVNKKDKLQISSNFHETVARYAEAL